MIRDSFFKLLRIKDIEAITVTDICRTAQINRGTFYRYYRNPFDLLQQQREQLFKETLAFIKYRFNEGEHTILPAIFEVLKKEDAEVVKASLDRRYGGDFLEKIFASCRETARPYIISQIKWMTDEQFEYFYAFITNGVIGTISLWVSQGMNPETGELEADIMTIVRKSIEQMSQTAKLKEVKG